MNCLPKSADFSPFFVEKTKITPAAEIIGLKEKARLFDFSTAEIVRPANKKFVTIEIDSYLESNPQSIQRIRLSMVLQDGVWMLDSATY